MLADALRQFIRDELDLMQLRRELGDYAPEPIVPGREYAEPSKTRLSMALAKYEEAA